MQLCKAIYRHDWENVEFQRNTSIQAVNRKGPTYEIIVMNNLWNYCKQTCIWNSNQQCDTFDRVIDYSCRTAIAWFLRHGIHCKGAFQRCNKISVHWREIQVNAMPQEYKALQSVSWKEEGLLYNSTHCLNTARDKY